MEHTAEYLIFGPMLLMGGIYLVGWAVETFRESGFEWLEVCAGICGLLTILTGVLATIEGIRGEILWYQITH